MIFRYKRSDITTFFMYVFLTSPFLKPELFNYIKFLDYTFNVWRMISLVTSMYLCIRKKCINRVTLLLVFLQSFLLGITYMSGGSIYELAVNSVCVVGMAFVYSLMIINVGCFLKSQLFCYEVAIYANLISILISPRGQIYQSDIFSYHNYFLCYYNNMGKFFYPAFVFALLNAYILRKRVRSGFLIATMCVSAVLMWSGGVLLGIFFMIVYILFLHRFSRIINFYTIWAQQFMFLGAYLIIGEISWVDKIVNDVLHKGASFRMRKNLWMWTISKIYERPILGHGFWNGMSRASFSGEIWQVHAHNLLLDTLFVGGIVYLLIFIVIIGVSGKNMESGNVVDVCLMTGFVGWSLQSNVDPFVTCTLMSLFVLLSNSKKIRLFRNEREIIGDDRIYFI